MHMNKRRTIIDKYEELWHTYAEKHHDHRFIETVLRFTCGFNADHGDKIERFPVLAIPVTKLRHPRNKPAWNYQIQEALWHDMEIVARKDDLAVFGTDCGKTPGAYKVFGERGIIEFLIGFKVNFVFGCVRQDVDIDIAHVGIPLGAIAFQASPRVGEAFAYMVNEYGGGLRYENHRNWSVFESE